MTIRCGKCGTTEPERFYPSTLQLRGANAKPRGGYCKACHLKYYQNRAKAKRGFWSQWQRKRRAKRMQMLRDLKVERGCIVCGEKHPACLEFHHRDQGSKEFALNKGVARQFSEKRLLAETEKCDVICSNCHRKLHWENREVDYGFAKRRHPDLVEAS